MRKENGEGTRSSRLSSQKKYVYLSDQFYNLFFLHIMLLKCIQYPFKVIDNYILWKKQTIILSQSCRKHSQAFLQGCTNSMYTLNVQNTACRLVMHVSPDVVRRNKKQCICVFAAYVTVFVYMCCCVCSPLSVQTQRRISEKSAEKTLS